MSKFIFSVMMACIPLFSLAQDQVEFELANANRSAEVEIYTQNGAVMIETWEENKVRIEMGNDVEYKQNVDGNRVRFEVTGQEHVAMKVYVPENTNLKAKSFQSGAIQIVGVKGNLEIDSYNGAVSAEDISGTAVISAWNGAISASFKEVDESPMAFTSYNGAISIVLPESTNATVRASVLNGHFYSAFQPAGEEMEYEMEKTEDGRQKWQIAQLGNGGPEWRIKSYNGAVSITRW